MGLGAGERDSAKTKFSPPWTREHELPHDAVTPPHEPYRHFSISIALE